MYTSIYIEIYYILTSCRGFEDKESSWRINVTRQKELKQEKMNGFLSVLGLFYVPKLKAVRQLTLNLFWLIFRQHWKRKVWIVVL